MRVAVLGAAGFVGRHVVERLRSDGHDVIAGDTAPDPFGGGLPYHSFDVRDEAAMRETMRGAEALVHLAAHPLPASLEAPRENARVNIEGGLNAFDAARSAGVKKVLFASASSLVGDVQYAPVDEAHPATPKTPYGVAKLALEHYLRVYRELYGLSYLVFRFFNVYGPGQGVASRALIPLVYDRLAHGKPVTVFGDGSSVRDYIYVADVAEFFSTALARPVPDGIVNLGTGHGATVLDVARLGAQVLGVEPVFDFQPARPGEIANFTADTTKLQRLFGRLPPTTLEVGLPPTFSWLARPSPSPVAAAGARRQHG